MIQLCQSLWQKMNWSKWFDIHGNAEGLDIVMSMYNLLECSDNYSMTSESLWIYYRDEVNADATEIVANYRINNSKVTTSRSFEYETKIIKRKPAINNILNAVVVVALNCLSNFWWSLDFPLINSEIEIDLENSWSTCKSSC